MWKGCESNMASLSVRVYYNQNWPDALIWGYKEGQELALIDTVTLNSVALDAQDEVICDHIFALLNGIYDDDPEWEPRTYRSMCVGDVVEIDGVYWACENLGWKKLEGDPVHG